MSVETRVDREETCPRRPASGWRRWKAALAVLVACGALLWHVLACVEGPMAFSPEGDLAFVAIDPPQVPAAEAGAEPAADKGGICRLFVLPQGERTLRVVEETAEHVLCAPAYSPDGKSLCYLRLPAEESESGERSESEAEDDQAEEPPPPELVSSEACQFDDLAFPSVSELGEFLQEVGDQPWTEATLVVRDAASGDVRSTTKMNLRLPESDEPFSALWTYSLSKAQYGPDGDWVYVCAGRLLLAINPGEKQLRLLAAPVWWASLAPDGKAVATIVGEREIGIVAADARRTVFTRLEPGVSLASAKGCAWVDNETVAALASRGDKGSFLLVLVRRDGTITRTLELPIQKDDGWVELAVSPDGSRIAIASKTALHLLDAEGSRVSEWTEKGLIACSPTFSPDSKQLACKLVPEADQEGCIAIAFFSADGEEQFRVDLPQAGGSAKP